MEKNQGWKLQSLLVLMLISAVMLFSADVSAAPQYTLTCASCHGNPPLDSAVRDPNTGAFQGNHQRHVNVASPALSLCNTCHNMTDNNTSHQNGQISFQSNINASPKGSARYQGVATFKNQTSIPVLGSCSDVSCHFESATPSWGSANFTASTSNCQSCHASPASSTGHSKHDAYYTFAANGCNKCHPDYSTSATFQHATSAGNRGIKVKLAEGSYSGTGLNYLPSQSGSRVLGNCSNLYCHSNGTNNVTFISQQTPTWGSTLTCNSCHLSSSTLSTGSHNKHISSTISSSLACYKCHSATVNASNTVVSLADHVDRLVTVKYSNSSTAVNGTYNGVNASTGKTALLPGTRTATCTNIYCHSKGDSVTAFAPMSTARWSGAMPAGCRGCHGGDATQVSARRITSGIHTKHMATYSYGCAECHSATVSANTTVSTPANHVNRKINVDLSANWGGSYSANGKLPGTAVGNCNNTYCHSNAQTASVYASQAWSGTLDCTGCHGNNTSNTLSGVHAKHVNNAAVIGTNFGCVDCHAKTVSSNTVISTLGNHVNKLRDYSGSKARGSSSYVSATGVCSNVYCHSNGKGTFKSMAAPNNWLGAGTLDCAGCHGSGATFGSPNYASGAAGSLTANSHSAHVKSAADCVKCHYKTTSTGTAIKAGATDHIDRTLDARFSKLGSFTNLSGVYNNTTKNCSNTYCHGTATAPVWGANGTLNCASCHTNMGAGTQTAAFVGAHSDHSTVYGFACEQCHATRALTPLSKANHAGGAVSLTKAAEVVFSNNSTVWKTIKYGDDATTNYKYRSMYSNPFVGAVTPSTTVGTSQTADKGFAWTAATCSNIWCHSNANPVGGTNSYATAPAWNTSITNCTSCHGNKTTVGGTGISAVHNKHVNTFAQGCVTCHSNTVASDTTLNATTGITYHVNGVKDVNITGGTYTPGSFTCSVAACHGSSTPAWNNSASGACGTCHLSTSTTAGGLINTNAHFAHFSTVGGSSKNYGPNYAATTDSQCANCHVGYTETASTHVNGSVNITTSTCTTACHPASGMAAPLTSWTAGNVTCESCHSTSSRSTISSVQAPVKDQFASYGHGTGNIGTGKTGNLCTDCHQRNAKHLTRALGDNNRLLTAMGSGLNKDDNLVCTYCHNTTTVGASMRNLPGHFAASLDSKTAVGCRNCHDPHGSGTNSHMIKSQIAFFSTTTQTISFTGTEFVNGSNRGLCQVCHRSTKYYRAGVTETVHFTTNCLQCHTHAGGGIAAFAASACDSCHGFPPVARNIGYAINSNIGRLNNYTGAKFEDYSGGGGAHSVAAHVSPTAKPADGFNACVTCHAQGSSSHNGSTPVKANIGNVTVKLAQTMQFKSGTQSIYSSAKFTTPPTNKSGSCFNLNCHIGKSPKWSTEK